MLEPATAVAVALAVAGFCAAALLPGLGFWDTGEFQTVGPVLGTAHPPGYPAYTLLGWVASVVLQPLGDPAYRMNLLSALLVGVAAGACVPLVRLLTGSLVLGVAAGLGMATTTLAWRIGTRADPHALHLALVALLLLALVAWQRERARDGGDRWLVAASAIFGVSVANHSLTLLLAPAVGLFVLAVDPWIWRRRFGVVVRCAVVLIGVAALLYLELPLRAGPFRAPLVYGTPDTWDGFRYVVTAEQFRGSIVEPLAELDRKLTELVDRTVTHLGVLAAVVPVAFVVAAVREPRYALLTGVGVGLTVFFNASYVNADIDRYYLGPLLVAWTWLAILAATLAHAVESFLQSAGRPRGGRARPLATAVLAALLLVPSVPELETRFHAVDSSDDRAAQRWVDQTIKRLEPDAVVVSWWSYSTPLWYAQHVEGRIPGVAIVDDRTRLDEELGEVPDVIERYLGRRPVYLIRSSDGELERLADTYRLEPGPVANALVKVVERREASR
jgi:Protein of unknown function (DUF2723)